MKWRVKLPDCEEPRMIAQRTLAGERVRRAEIVGSCVAEERLHVAERGGADAEHVRILHRVDQLIELRRIEAVAPSGRRCTGSAGDRQSGAAKVPPPQNFQSLFGIVPPSVTTPLIGLLQMHVAASRRCCRSALAGKYGIGLPITFSGAAFVPLRLMMRPKIFPVTPASTGVFT